MAVNEEREEVYVAITAWLTSFYMLCIKQLTCSTQL